MTGYKVYGGSPGENRSNVVELFEFIIAYVKQEALAPIRGALRWIGFGIAAAVLISIGIAFGILGLLRLIQTSSFVDRQGLSWTSYFFALIICLIVVKIVSARVRRGTLAKGRNK